MKWFDNQKFLVLYSGVLTTTVAVALLSGFANVGGPKFDTITCRCPPLTALSQLFADSAAVAR